jgi:hypothetical protein
LLYYLRMLLLDPAPRLRDQIVALLCRHSPMSVGDIQKKTRKGSKKYSKQAIYKELALLEDCGIAVKTKNKYRLTLTWLFQFVSHAELLLHEVSKGRFADDLIPTAGQHKSWRFTDHRSIDRLWAQLTSALLLKVADPIMYQAIQHPWWALLYKDLGKQFRTVLSKSSGTTYCVIDGDTYLDRLFIKNFPKGGSRCSNAPGFFGGQVPAYMTVIDRYVITTQYPVKFRRDLDDYFQSVRSQRDIQAGEVLQLFQSPGKITTKIEHNTRKSLWLRRKFQRFFGLPLSK